MKRLTVAVAAQESAGVKAIRLVVERGHRLAAVLTERSKEPSGVSGIESAARGTGAEVYDAALVTDAGFAEHLAGVDLLVNAHSLYVAHPAVVEAPRIGSFNLHPGPLPLYPGLNAPSWAIYDGATAYGCTVHWMDSGIDTGYIAYAEAFPIEPDDTGLSLTSRCVRKGIPLLARLLDDAAAGARDAIPSVEQVGERLERGPGPPDRGRIAWGSSAARIAAFVRACDYLPFTSPWGHPRTTVDGTEFEMLRCSPEATEGPPRAAPGEVVDTEGGSLVVATGQGLLRVSRLRRDGETIDASAAARPGDRFRT